MLAALALTACAWTQQKNMAGFSDLTSNFYLSWHQATFTKHSDLPVSYFPATNWRIDAGSDQPGRLIGVWLLNQSNDVTTAYMSVGVSQNKDSVAACLTPGAGHQNVQTNQVMIGGRPFTHFHLSSAGMNHYRKTEAYRSRYDGHCYAIDLVVQGTNPQVYDPPRLPPFSQRQAIEALSQLRAKINWLAMPAPATP